MFFFSFHHRAGLFKKKIILIVWKKGWINLFYKSHKVFIESAIANPDKNYIIKIKWKNNWFDQILKIKNSITKKDIPNLKIVWNEDVLNLIEIKQNYNIQFICNFRVFNKKENNYLFKFCRNRKSKV